MRKKATLLITFLMLLIGINSCNTTSPDKFFQITVLNLNVIRDFSSQEMTKNLELYAKEFEGHKRKGFEAQDYIETKVSYIKQTIKG